MDKNEKIKVMLNSVLVSVKEVTQKFLENKGVRAPGSNGVEGRVVLVGLTGEIKGRLLINGSDGFFSNVGKSMYGMDLEGDMLDSFSSELGNMVAGNTGRVLESEGIHIDITAPTLVNGKVGVSGVEKGLSVDLVIEGDEVEIVLLLDE